MLAGNGIAATHEGMDRLHCHVPIFGFPYFVVEMTSVAC